VGNAFRVHPHPFAEQISAASVRGGYDGDDHASLWIDDDIYGRHLRSAFTVGSVAYAILQRS